MKKLLVGLALLSLLFLSAYGGYRACDYFLDLSRGLITGQTSEFKFGRSSDITTTESVVWDGGGSYVFLEAAELLSIVSDNVNDDIGGTGANIVVVFGLDSDFKDQNEAVQMDGLTPVLTQNEYIRVFRALVLTSGTNDPVTDANEGNITITSNDTTTLQAKILPRNGQTLMAVYTVPAGKIGYITGLSFTAGEGKQVLFKAKFRNGPDPTNAFSVKFTMDLFQNQFYGMLKVPLRLPEKTDIAITAITSASAGVDGSTSFGIILVDD